MQRGHTLLHTNPSSELNWEYWNCDAAKLPNMPVCSNTKFWFLCTALTQNLPWSHSLYTVKTFHNAPSSLLNSSENVQCSIQALWKSNKTTDAGNIKVAMTNLNSYSQFSYVNFNPSGKNFITELLKLIYHIWHPGKHFKQAYLSGSGWHDHSHDVFLKSSQRKCNPAYILELEIMICIAICRIAHIHLNYPRKKKHPFRNPKSSSSLRKLCITGKHILAWIQLLLSLSKQKCLLVDFVHAQILFCFHGWWHTHGLANGFLHITELDLCCWEFKKMYHSFSNPDDLAKRMWLCYG